MKGLILKDLLFIKNNLRALVVFIFCIAMFAFNKESDPTTVLMFLPFFLTMLTISTFSYDEYNKWNSYAITLPGGRKVIVKSKYITAFIMMIIGVLFSFIVLIAMSFINTKVNIKDGFITLLGSLAGMSIIISVMYPLIYKFGIEKGRIALFVIIIVISMCAGLLLNAIDIPKLIPFLDRFGVFIIPVICILFLYISYKISLNIYNKREY